MSVETPPFPTSKQNIALDLIMGWLKESLINRTAAEYSQIAARLPKLEALHAYVNQKLRELAALGHEPYQICYFKSGDQYPRYEKFSTALSRETVRKALINCGL